MITIIFSRDRALQLDLTLKSLYANTDEYMDIHVIYTCSNDRHEKSYEILKKEHKFVDFVREIDFKTDLLRLLHDKMYVLFCVDDCVFTNHFNMNEIINLLDVNNDAIGFSLRLGVNTTNCYSVNALQQFPPCVKVKENILMFGWYKADLDFGYPLELSSSVYRVPDINPILCNLDYRNPNELEWMMYCSLNAYREYKPLLMCYETSIAFCNPINRVQTTNNNRCGNKYSSDLLLTEFEKCGRINYLDFQGLVSNGAHEEKEIAIGYN